MSQPRWRSAIPGPLRWNEEDSGSLAPAPYGETIISVIQWSVAVNSALIRNDLPHGLRKKL